ncbi:uncharacterized protein ARMOST_18615 [Armillaria ostoyae]|uniref:Uncharacterized protein n=1 Tax=Armillaria ostoyae TaxID=47428 RepID=A0A284S272_ARMOS|nr:uncharacterized protein ARMOST_18615 [Armillaria ostoyae]
MTTSQHLPTTNEIYQVSTDRLVPVDVNLGPQTFDWG